MYKVKISRTAEKDLKALPAQTIKRISKAIDGLEKNPRPAGCKKLKGTKEELWRIRVGDYRIIYSVDDSLLIVDIRKIGDRKDIY